MRLIKSPYTRWVIYPALFIFTYPLIERVVWMYSEFNGLSIDAPLIPVDEIKHGGPPRDGIPSLDKPKFIQAQQNRQLQDSSKVLGLSYGGISKAYPIQILDHHEIVNDDFQGMPVLISYCPLCGTGMAFDARINGDNLHFGVSGLLYNSDVLMYDKETNSLWSQVLAKAISGEMKGNVLKMLPLEHTTWKTRYPNTLLLSFDTGYKRDYQLSPMQVTPILISFIFQ